MPPSTRLIRPVIRPLVGFALSVLVAAASMGCAAGISDKAREKARINYDLGVASLDRGQVREALRALMVSVQEDPELPEARNAMGLVLQAMGETDKACAQYARAVALRPGFSEAHNNLGTVLLELERPDEAIAEFRIALSDILYPTPYLAQGNLGWAHHLKGENASAKEALARAVQIEPRFCRGYQWLTRIAAEEGNIRDALVQAEKFERHCIKDRAVSAAVHDDVRREMNYHRAIGYLRTGKRAQAMQYLRLCADTQDDEFGGKCHRSLQALQ